MQNEIFAITLRAYGPGCIGCKRHKKHLMISFQTEKRDKVYDLFVDEETALSFRGELNARMKERE